MKSFIFAILRKIVLEIPALYLLNALVPLYGIAYGANNQILFVKGNYIPALLSQLDRWCLPPPDTKNSPLPYHFLSGSSPCFGKIFQGNKERPTIEMCKIH